MKIGGRFDLRPMIFGDLCVLAKPRFRKSPRGCTDSGRVCNDSLSKTDHRSFGCLIAKAVGVPLVLRVQSVQGFAAIESVGNIANIMKTESTNSVEKYELIHRKIDYRQ